MNRFDLTVVAANMDSPEWARLLVASIRRFRTIDVEILIVDNGSAPASLDWLAAQSDVHLIRNYVNMGHGVALDQGLQRASGRFIACLDIDAHFQRPGWDADLISAYERHPLTRMVGVAGSALKPAHPPLWMVEKAWAVNNGVSFQHIPGVTVDTAQGAYQRVLDLGFRAILLPKGAKLYPDCRGDEIYVAGQPTIFHAWYGTRFRENTAAAKGELDGYRIEDHLMDKKRVFAQPLVRSLIDE